MYIREPLGRAKWFIILAFFGMLISSASQVLEPVIYGTIVDTIIEALSTDTSATLFWDIVPLLLAWIGLFIVTTLFSTIGLYAGWRAGGVVSEITSHQSFAELLGWSQQRFERSESGKLMKIWEDAMRGLFVFFDQILLNILPTFLSFTFVVVIGFIVDWRMTVIALTVVPVSVRLGWFSWKHAQPKQLALSKGRAKIYDEVNATIQNIRPIQNFAQEKRRNRLFSKLFMDNVGRQVRVNVFWSLFHGGGSSIVLLARIVLFGAGVIFVSEGTLSVGSLITFLGLVNFMLVPVMYMISNALPRLSENVTSIQLFLQLFDQENDVEDLEGARPLRRVNGKVELRGVSFTYASQTKSTVKSLDLEIPAGTSCAFVGPSGAGKSTLAKLLNRTIDPTKGSVLLDDVDIRAYTLQSLRKQIGVVTQGTVLFHDSIEKNIRFVRPGASKKDIITACKQAQAHDFIKNLPKGYDSIVGERGVKLSGGERQRIAIARIFLVDPPVLILDESTSALDSETEHKLQEVLKRVMKDRTTILIAHRLSTIYLADQIVVMENGRIIDSGDHAELVKNGGLYQRLWSLQSGGYNDR